MGITISSKRFSCDMGYFGFKRFRQMVADSVGIEIADHYNALEKAMVIFGETERIKFFKEYDEKTEQLIKDNKLSDEVANFLYQSDCEGKIDRKQVMEIYNLIKKCNDDIIFGYQGRDDCAKMSDMKKIFSDKTKVNWY